MLKMISNVIVWYLVQQIKKKRVSYETVIAKYPQYKEAIDKALGKN